MRKFFAFILSLAVTLTLLSGALHPKTAYADWSFNPDVEYDSVIKAYKSVTAYDEWTSVADAVYGNPVDPTFTNQLIQKVKDTGGVYTKGTELGKTLIALSAAQQDVTNVGGINLLQSFANFDKNKLVDSNDVVYMLLGLDAGKYELPAGAALTRQWLIDKLLSYDLSQQGDMTGTIMMALAPYKNDPHVKSFLDTGVAALKGKQFDNSDSLALAIAGLAAVGVDPMGDDFEQGGKKALIALHDYIAPDGTYKWKTSDSTGNAFSTKDAMIAIVGYKKFLNGKNSGIFYDLNNVAKVHVEVVSPSKTHAGIPVSKDVLVKDGDTAFDALKAAVGESNIAYSVHAQWGVMIQGILGLNNTDDWKNFWSFYVNGTMADVGVGSYIVHGGETITLSYYVTPADDSGTPGGSSKVVNIRIASQVTWSGLPKSGTVPFTEGMTALDALVAYAGSNVSYSGSGSSAYVSAIYGLKEMAYGSTSGWTYQVNGSSPSVGAGATVLHEGDKLVWTYVGKEPTTGGGSGGPVGPGGGAPSNEQPVDTSNGSTEQPTGTQPPVESGKPANAGPDITPAAVAESLAKFSDGVRVSDWAEKAIARAERLGFLAGIPAGGGKMEIRPQASITRAQFLTILMKIKYGDQLPAGEASFKDVPANAWYAKQVAAAVKAGIVSGFADGSFRPDEVITREQMAILIARANGIQSDYIQYTQNQGLILGDGKGFNPTGKATREMAVVVAIRLYDKLNP